MDTKVDRGASDFNECMAAQFRKAACVLRRQHADSFRVTAYEHGAEQLERMDESAAAVYRRDGLGGLIALPSIGRALASAIADVEEFGHWRWLERLEGNSDPEAVLAAIPTIGPKFARRLHVELGVESLTDLERAVYDGRLGRMRGVGDKRWHAIRDSLLARRRCRESSIEHQEPHLPTRQDVLSIDTEYRMKVDQGRLAKVAPRRFNPTEAHWLPVLHTTRGGRDFTAMFSNTARAHELGHTGDWVVIAADDADDESWTVVTEATGPDGCNRVVRGHCEMPKRDRGDDPEHIERGMTQRPTQPD